MVTPDRTLTYELEKTAPSFSLIGAKVGEGEAPSSVSVVVVMAPSKAHVE
jgi:hypothetical protein